MNHSPRPGPQGELSDLKLPALLDTSTLLSVGTLSPSALPHSIYLQPLINKKIIERKRDKGVEMFATALKSKEVEFQLKLMENRLKKLQDEEDRAMKKIQETI